MPNGMLGDAFEWGGTLQEVAARAVEHVERFKMNGPQILQVETKPGQRNSLGVSYKTLLNKIRLLASKTDRKLPPLKSNATIK